MLTGPIFGSVLVVLVSLASCSLLSVASYTALLLLTAVAVAKVAAFVMVKAGKVEEGFDPHPQVRASGDDPRVSCCLCRPLLRKVISELWSRLSPLTSHLPSNLTKRLSCPPVKNELDNSDFTFPNFFIWTFPRDISTS